MKICSDCKENKSYDEFYSSEKESKTKGKYTYYHPYCKQCSSNRSQKWEKENPENKIKNRRRYDSSDKRREVNKKNNHRRRISGKHQEWIKRVNYSYKKYNEKHNITKEEWEVCKAYFNNSCAYCGISEEEHLVIAKQRLHKEHVDPKGSNSIENCIPSCRVCNSGKGNSLLVNWYSNKNKFFTEDKYQKIIKWIEEDYFNLTKRPELQVLNNL